MNQFTVSLWGDEAWAATLASKPVFDIIRLVSRDTSPPLYYLFEHLWMKIFGTSEVAIRSLSFVFFLGLILTVFLISLHLFNKRNALLAALLTFVNPFLFQYAFEGRMYALLALTSTLSIYFFLKKNRAGFILATLAALYTHHFAIFIVFFEFIWKLSETITRPKKILANFIDFVMIGLFYLPWFYPLYYQTSLVKSGFWLGKPVLEDIKDLTFKFLVGSDKTFTRQIALWSVYALLLFRLWHKSLTKSLFLAGWFAMPILLTYFLSQVFQPIFYDRYLLMSIPALTIFLASLSRKISLVPISIIILSLAIMNWQYFTHPTKKPFRELANFVKNEASDLPRINYNSASHHLFESKYYGIPAPIYSSQPLPFYTGTALMEKGDVISELPKTKLLLAITSENPDKVGLEAWQVKKTKSFGSLSLIWFEKIKGK